MKYITGIFIFIFTASGLYAQPFVLTGTIRGLDTGYILLRYNDELNQKKSVVSKLQGGRFSFTGTVNRIADALLTIDSTKIGVDFNAFRYLYIEPGNSELLFKSANLRELNYSDSKTQLEWDSLRLMKRPFQIQQNAFGRVIDSVRNELKSGAISHNLADSILKINVAASMRISAHLNKMDISFIQNNPSSYAAFTVLRELVGYIPVDSIDLLYQHIDQRNLGCYLDYDFVRYFNRYRKSITDEYPFDRIEIGKTAPPFQVWSSVDSLEKVDFAGLTGSITLIEFWGLNCIPCLKQNLILDSLNKSLGGKIKILAVSNTATNDYPKLLNYVERNKFLNWLCINVNISVGVKSPEIYFGNFDAYKGAGIPRTVLLDKKGKVVYLKDGYSQEQIIQLASMLNQLVNEDHP
jgi:thiol-disulfide isomerase/thioredoxin